MTPDEARAAYVAALRSNGRIDFDGKEMPRLRHVGKHASKTDWGGIGSAVSELATALCKLEAMIFFIVLAVVILVVI